MISCMLKLNVYSMATEVKHRRHRWLGNVLRMEQKGFPRRAEDGIRQAKGNREGHK